MKAKELNFYKGFVIINDEGSNVFSVLHSDIEGVIDLDAVKKEIDRNLKLNNKEVATYRGISIIRVWQNVECIVRNGKEMVDNGFYYQIPIHPFNGTLYESLNHIKWHIDRDIEDRDDFNKNQFPIEYKKFLSKVIV